MSRIVLRIMFWGAVLNRRTGWRPSRFNAWIYRVTGGVLGNTVPGTFVILLTTTGRRSGRRWTVPVAAWNDGDDLMIGSGSGGSPTEPQWFLNLCADPRANVQLKRDVFSVRATIVDDPERAALIERISSPVVNLHEALLRRPSLVRLTPASGRRDV